MMDLISNKNSSLENIVEIEKGLKELKGKYRFLSQTPMETKAERENLEEEMDASRKHLQWENHHIEEVNFEIEKLEKIIDGARIISVISVDQVNFGFSNGLVDLNRDVLMRLLRQISEGKIKNIIGMAYIFYAWSKTRIFQCFVRGLRGKWSSVHKSADVMISANGAMAVISNREGLTLSSPHAVTIGDTKVRFGKAVVSVRSHSFDSRCLVLGVLSRLPSNFSSEWKYVLSEFLYYLRGDEDRIGGKQSIATNGRFMSGDTVTMEVDVDTGTLSFFKNKQTEPLVSLTDTHIKKGVYLAGMLGEVGSRFVIVGLTYDE